MFVFQGVDFNIPFPLPFLDLKSKASSRLESSSRGRFFFLGGGGESLRRVVAEKNGLDDWVVLISLTSSSVA